MNNLSSKQYVIDQGPTDPSDITTGTFTDTCGFGGGTVTRTFSYYKVGKLYFGFNVYDTDGGGGSPVGVIMDMPGLSAATSAARIAVAIGVTVDTVYTNATQCSNTSNVQFRCGYNGTNWINNGNNPTSVLTAFLAN